MPGSCLDTFNGKLDSMFGSINNNKVHIICGDFSIDLQNHMETIVNFIDTMYSNNLFPVITKPSRITLDTVALIDNIFTNTLESQVK